MDDEAHQKEVEKSSVITRAIAAAKEKEAADRQQFLE